jgi:hypothetical protein
MPVNDHTVLIPDANYAFFLDLISRADQIITGHGRVGVTGTILDSEEI